MMSDPSGGITESTPPPESGRRRDAPERSHSRVLIAALITAGFAFSAGVCPSLGRLHVFGEALPPLITAKSIDFVPPGSLDSPGPNLMSFEHRDIAKLVKLLDAAAAELPTETLVRLVTESRLRDTAASLEIVTSVGPVVSTGLVATGSGGTSAFSTAEMPPELLMLIELIMQKASASGAAVLKMVADLVSTLVYSIGVKPDVMGPVPQGVPTEQVPVAPPAPVTPGPSTAPSGSIAPTPAPPPVPATEAQTAPPTAESMVPPQPAVEVQVPEIVTATVTATPSPSPDITPVPSNSPSSPVPEPETPNQEDEALAGQGSGDAGNPNGDGSVDSPFSDGSEPTSSGVQHNGAGGGSTDNADGSTDNGSSGESSTGSDSGPAGVD